MTNETPSARFTPRDRLRAAIRTIFALRFARFCVVGASGYVINLLVYKGSIDLFGFKPVLAAVVAFLVAATSNYNLNRRWTFALEFPTIWSVVGFCAVALVCLGLNILLLKVGIAEGLDALPAQALSVIAVVPVNFTATRAMFSFTSRTTGRGASGTSNDAGADDSRSQPPGAPMAEGASGKQ